MTLPQLYVNVSLHSYDHIRFSPHDGRSEGCGAASPFLMGLNGLVSRNISGYVKAFRVWPSNDLSNLKVLRFDTVSKAQGEHLAKIRGIEKIYMIGARKGPGEGMNGSHANTPTISINASPAPGPQSAPSSTSDMGTHTLTKNYIDNIINGSGSTLRHLLLKPQWRLSPEKLAALVRRCPNLE